MATIFPDEILVKIIRGGVSSFTLGFVSRAPLERHGRSFRRLAMTTTDLHTQESLDFTKALRLVNKTFYHEVYRNGYDGILHCPKNESPGRNKVKRFVDQLGRVAPYVSTLTIHEAPHPTLNLGTAKLAGYMPNLTDLTFDHVTYPDCYELDYEPEVRSLRSYLHGDCKAVASSAIYKNVVDKGVKISFVVRWRRRKDQSIFEARLQDDGALFVREQVRYNMDGYLYSASNSKSYSLNWTE